MTLPAHSKLGASAMHRWAECPGSIRLSAGLGSSSSVFAAEGSAAHELAAKCLENGNDADVYGGGWEYDSHKGDITDEMTDAVQVYLDAVRGDSVDNDGAPIRLVEHKFHLKELHRDLFGTADCVQVWPGAKLLRIYDYKHGAGVPVDVESNPQLLYYALGTLLSYKKPITDVEIIIVQPRCPHTDGPVRRHRIKAVELLEFEADLMDAVRRTELPDAPLKTGEWCRWCPAAALCPETKRIAQAAAKSEFSSASPYDPAELAATLELLPMLEGWLSSVREFAYGEALHGRTPPGYKLVNKRPTRKWKIDDHTVEMELGRIGLAESDIYAPRKVQSPAQIEKVIGKSKKNADKLAVVSELCESVSSGLKLVPVSEPGEAVKRSAQEDFKNAD
ncbi:MAG TPA: DUF2800 domain-containing protein [Acidiferrobacterales bacterium]|nr:DUF2800 domain-containing protein [Acidiferrobacterales bacterium]